MTLVVNSLRGTRQRWLAAYATYAALFLALTFPYWVQGSLVIPYVPYSDFSSAFPRSWLVAQFVDEPFLFLTLLATINCCLAGLLMMLFCAEVGLSRGAALALILSRDRIEDPSLEYLGDQDSVHLHRVRERMGFARQMPLAADSLAASELFIDLRERVGTEPRLVGEEGAMLGFAIDPGRRSLLVLSQTFHDDWKAEILGTHRWERAATIAVNGVFQGVLVPATATEVRLTFKPAARLAPLARYVWAGLLLAVLADILWARFRSDGRQHAAEVK